MTSWSCVASIDLPFKVNEGRSGGEAAGPWPRLWSCLEAVTATFVLSKPLWFLKQHNLGKFSPTTLLTLLRQPSTCLWWLLVLTNDGGPFEATGAAFASEARISSSSSLWQTSKKNSLSKIDNWKNYIRFRRENSKYEARNRMKQRKWTVGLGHKIDLNA